LALDALRGWQTRRAASFSLFVEGRFAGIAAIDRIDWQAGSGHLCYWVGAPYWHRGVGSWAVGELVQWARQAHHPQGRLSTLFANCLADNAASVRILCKNGFHEHSHFLGSGDHGGKFADRRWTRYARVLR
jgi:RimJ/RimL family protein N-acetyltransferase